MFFDGDHMTLPSPVKDRAEQALLENLSVKVESLEKSIVKTQQENSKMLHTLGNFVKEINEAIHLVVKYQEKTAQDCLSGIAYISQKSKTMNEQFVLIEKAITDTNKMVSKLKTPPNTFDKAGNPSLIKKSKKRLYLHS